MKFSLTDFLKRGRLILHSCYDLFFPRDCAGCENPLQTPLPFCADCLSTLRRIEGPTCARCGEPFVSDAATSHSPEQQCGDCRADPPLFSKAITPFVYEGALARGIRQFKYKKQTILADFFAQLLMDDLAALRNTDYRLIPIPLHRDRLLNREFNQSLLLASKMAKPLSLPYSISALIRVRPTPPQVGLSRKARAANVKEAFQVLHPDWVRDHKILLVDDVYTTGSTLKEAAKTLIRAGAQEIVAVTLARMVKEMGSMNDA